MPLFGTDRDILETALEWIQQGHRPALVTVLKTWGSAPRPIGSLMLMRGDGRFSGSVSGGCVETDLVSRYRDGQLGDVFPTMIDYGVDREQAGRLGLPCGGRLELLVECLDAAPPLQQLLAAVKSGRLLARRVCLDTGEVSLHPATAAEEFSRTGAVVSKVFGPRWQLLLIGAGQLSRYVAQIALTLDYRVIVCDPRDGGDRETFTAGVEQISLMPDEAVRQYADHRRGVVVALTHDPKLDDMALLDALASRAFYVGAIGSRRNSELRRERLRELGITEQQLQRLNAPVGLAIGSRTPPEIALSIMAQITSLRHQAARRAGAAASAA